MKMLRIVCLLFGGLYVSCQQDGTNDDHMIKYESFYSPNRRFTLFLHPDSTFIFQYFPGTDYVEKEYGTWLLRDGQIALKQGVMLDNVIKVSYEDGESESLSFSFEDRVLKKFPGMKINLFDTSDISVTSPSLSIDKRRYINGADWNQFDRFFVSDIKLKSGAYFLPLFNFSPTKAIHVKLDTQAQMQSIESKVLLEFRVHQDSIVPVSENSKYGFSVLYQRRPYDADLAARINRLAEIDQSIQSLFDTVPKSELEASVVSEYEDRLRNNYVEAREIFKQFGFPGRDLVGEVASSNFWLIVQHSDNDPQFQQDVLNEIKNEVKRHNASPQNLAYLTDRVKINLGESQVFGTQIYYDAEGVAKVKRLDDLDNVDSLRVSVGLDSLEDYLNLMTMLRLRPGDTLKTPVTIKFK